MICGLDAVERKEVSGAHHTSPLSDTKHRGGEVLAAVRLMSRSYQPADSTPRPRFPIQEHAAPSTPSKDIPAKLAKADLRRFCPVSKAVRNAGMEIDEIWNVNRR
jgi:hypothetical protein